MNVVFLSAPSFVIVGSLCSSVTGLLVCLSDVFVENELVDLPTTMVNDSTPFDPLYSQPHLETLDFSS